MRDGQREAGRLRTDMTRLHEARRRVGGAWLTETELRHAAKGGGYRLHSQTIQAAIRGLIANVDATTARRRAEPASRRWLRYPYRDKTFHPLAWPAQAVSYDPAAQRLVLPMGRGRKSLVFKLDLDFQPGAARLVWKDGYELHLNRPVTAQPMNETESRVRAAIDLGEIHTAAVVTDHGTALLISGRGIRADKRLLSKQLGQIARLRARCKKHSRRWRRLMAARRRVSRVARRRIRDARHKASRRVVDFCVAARVTDLYVGNPHGVGGGAGRQHNQRMARWEYGKDIDYLQHKSQMAGIACSTGDERGTSSRCPQCGHRHKPKGREWRCRACGFVGHRDLVGGTNMHQNGFDIAVTFPALVTYRRPGPNRAGRGVNSRDRISPARRSRVDTPLREPLRGPAVVLEVTRIQAPGLPGRRKPQPKAA